VTVVDAQRLTLARGNLGVEQQVVVHQRQAMGRSHIANHLVDAVAVEVEVGLEHHWEVVSPGQLHQTGQVVLQLPPVRTGVDDHAPCVSLGRAARFEGLVGRGGADGPTPDHAPHAVDAQRVGEGPGSRRQDRRATEPLFPEAPVAAVRQVVVVVVSGEHEQQVRPVPGNLFRQVPQGLGGVGSRPADVDLAEAHARGERVESLDEVVRIASVGCALGPRVSDAENVEHAFAVLAVRPVPLGTEQGTRGAESELQRDEGEQQAAESEPDAAQPAGRAGRNWRRGRGRGFPFHLGRS
jgi:hypothetical protein